MSFHNNMYLKVSEWKRNWLSEEFGNNSYLMVCDGYVNIENVILQKSLTMNSEDQETNSRHEEHSKENMFKMIPKIRKQGKR